MRVLVNSNLISKNSNKIVWKISVQLLIIYLGDNSLKFWGTLCKTENCEVIFKTTLSRKHLFQLKITENINLKII